MDHPRSFYRRGILLNLGALAFVPMFMFAWLASDAGFFGVGVLVSLVPTAFCIRSFLYYQPLSIASSRLLLFGLILGFGGAIVAIVAEAATLGAEHPYVLFAALSWSAVSVTVAFWSAVLTPAFGAFLWWRLGRGKPF